MRSLIIVALTVPLSAFFADVVPHCGGPEVVIRNPGEDCGHHGSRWRGDCRGPAACFVVDGDGAMCTVRCATDADCQAFEPGFTCSAQGQLYSAREGDRRHSVCRRAK